MSLKSRLHAGEQIVGTFVKTPSPIMVEVLGLTDLDCLCLDAEHAPFDRLAIDGCIMAARAADKDLLVRVPATTPEHILNALDCGAAGIVAPHIRSADEARALVRACHYGHGGRGYAGSSRAAAYTTRSMAENIAAARDRTTIIAQIEDPEAIEAIENIAAVEGIDALFVGRADLTVAYGVESQDDPRVVEAIERVCLAGQRHKRPVGLFLARWVDVPLWMEKGATLFLLGSDHGFLLSGAADLLRRTRC
jgi:2-keto-3-deoxy-L-rhamnonate aldolase RhmA